MEPMTFYVDGESYIFRVPVMKDVLRVNQSLPLLVTEDTKDDDSEDDAFRKMAEDPEKLIRFLERVDEMLCIVALRPRLVTSYDIDPTDGVRPVQSLRDQDKAHIYLSLLGASGYNDEAAVSIAPFSVADALSSGSTASVEDTASAPASSSAT